RHVMPKLRSRSWIRNHGLVTRTEVLRSTLHPMLNVAFKSRALRVVIDPLHIHVLIIDSPRITRLLTRMPNRDVKSVALLLNKVPQLLTQSCRIRHPSRIKFTENRKSTLEIRVTERLRVTLHTQRL